ncbi:MAG: signal peptidase II [Sphingomonadales bacterium 32-68-7]|nr:MAG: signal peptidase II [Sphingomonadales bacterium 12-68-11]OYX09799.1 MAG: signal peptidase II [Sphingomonadales bacterium 32-68-7]
MNPLWRNRAIGLALAAAIYAADQWLKWLVVERLGLKSVGDNLYLLPFFDFTRTNNFGVSLGMFPATSPEMRWGLVAVTGLISLVVLVWLLRERKLGEILPLGLVLGGALGNIKDRYEFGYVIDFADLHFGEFRPFMIFNLADAAISIGVAIILARALFMREKPPAPHSAGEAPSPSENS